MSFTTKIDFINYKWDNPNLDKTQNASKALSETDSFILVKDVTGSKILPNVITSSRSYEHFLL